MKKRLLVGASAAIIGITSVAGLGMASAETNSNGQTSLIDKIAQKFNLNKDEVKAVFEADRSERHAEMEAKAKEHLTQAVKDGKLTQEQADKITAKRAEMKAFRESLEGKTDEERKTAMEANREELKKWAADNDIPMKYVHGPHIGHGRGHGKFEGEKLIDKE